MKETTTLRKLTEEDDDNRASRAYLLTGDCVCSINNKIILRKEFRERLGYFWIKILLIRFPNLSIFR